MADVWSGDAELGDVLIELKFGASSLRSLSDALFQVATVLGHHPDMRGYIVLVNPVITYRRIEEEWQKVQLILRSQILQRMAICLYEDGKITSVPPLPDERIADLIRLAVGEHSASRPPRSSDAFLDIFRVLMVHWFRRHGPITSKELSAQAGFSYPTIARALELLEPYLLRHSDRSFELKRFPKDPWSRLVAQMDKVRHTQYFADRSGRPRSPNALLSRFREMNREDAAVGGVHGVRHYLPSLDLVGDIRLDLLVHKLRNEEVTEIVRKLDPALKPARPGEPPNLVINFIYRPNAFYEWDSRSGVNYADQVECLLDLHNARLEPQAQEFIDGLTPPK